MGEKIYLKKRQKKNIVKLESRLVSVQRRKKIYTQEKSTSILIWKETKKKENNNTVKRKVKNSTKLEKNEPHSTTCHTKPWKNYTNNKNQQIINSRNTTKPVKQQNNKKSRNNDNQNNKDDGDNTTKEVNWETPWNSAASKGRQRGDADCVKEREKRRKRGRG